MAFQAVLFDFSGTLFRLEQDETWLADLTNVGGDPLEVEAQTELMRRMTAPVGQIATLDAEHQHAWENRDLDPALHRKVYLEVLKQSGIPRAEQATALYERLIDPAQWTPYPDTESALKQVRARELAVGVISNIAFDIRPAFTGLTSYINDFVLSFEHGVIKPDPAIFLLASRRLGVAPEDTLMIGDSEQADGGAKRLGCAFALVEPEPTTRRRTGLLDALRAHGVL